MEVGLFEECDADGILLFGKHWAEVNRPEV